MPQSLLQLRLKSSKVRVWMESGWMTLPSPSLRRPLPKTQCHCMQAKNRWNQTAHTTFLKHEMIFSARGVRLEEVIVCQNNMFYRLPSLVLEVRQNREDESRCLRLKTGRGRQQTLRHVCSIHLQHLLPD